MNDEARRTLGELIQRHGPDLALDPRRLEGLLRDYCGEHRREIHVLVGAAREGVPQQLLDATTSVPAVLRRARLVQMLEDSLAIERTAAEWAVDAWADSLGVAVAAPVVSEHREPIPAPMALVPEPAWGPSVSVPPPPLRVPDVRGAGRGNNRVIAGVVAGAIVLVVIAFVQRGPSSSISVPGVAPAAASKAAAPQDWSVVGSGLVSGALASNPVNSWSDDLETGSSQVLNGKWRYTARARSPFLDVRDFSVPTGPTFHLTLNVIEVNGTQTSFYGLVFHRLRGPSRYYSVQINASQHIKVDRAAPPNVVPIVTDRGGTHADQGAVNRLAVRGEGTHYSFFVNDHLESEIDDSTLTAGVAGVIVGADRTGDAVTVDFGTYELRAPRSN